MRHGVTLLFLAAATASAQPATTVRGSVISASAPVRGANVFLLQTLEGALADSAGRFSFTTTHSGPATLVISARGMSEVRRQIELPTADPILVVMKKGTQSLAPTTIVASRYAASDESGATLTTLDVVSTPGTNADVMRAIQTLPGVQNVDEGTGLYVRGGDYTETHVLLNDAVLQTAFTFESPNGTFIGTVDPFQLDGIYFSSGGFGVKYGNALSGMVALNTLGRPTKQSGTAGAGLAALSVAGAVPMGKTAGLRIAANQFDTDLLFRVNGSTIDFDLPPQGYDRSASFIWSYRPTAELKVYAIKQTNNLASVIEEPSNRGTYTLGIGSHLAVANWSDVYGVWSPSLRVSDTRLDRSQDYGNYRLETGQRYSAASGQLGWAPAGALTLRAGLEGERYRTDLDGTIPDFGFDKKPGARSTVVLSHLDGDRVATYGESDFLVGSRTRLVAGVRQDHSTLTGSSTIDPRVSAAITIVKDVILTSAWGVYHQVPDPIFYDTTIGMPGLPSMRATHTIAGIQAGRSGSMFRFEYFDKRYRDLAQVSRDYDIVAGGVGSSRGFDLFASGTAIQGMKWRVSWSRLTSTRTDPNSGTVVRSPFDVSNSVTTVVNHSFTPAWHLGFSHRYATGRPMTPVTSATFDGANDVWVPTYGAPMSERLPSFNRVDLGFTHIRRVGPAQAVFYSSVSNVLDRENIYMYRYSTDYSTRIPIRSLFKRSYYVGASFTKL